MIVEFNSPVTLLLVLVSCAVHIADSFVGFPLSTTYFGAWPWSFFRFDSALSYWRLVSHVFGHVSTAHLAGNAQLLLVVGPACEEKYGSRILLRLVVITAAVSGLLHSACSRDEVLLGASGIVFMLILLNRYGDTLLRVVRRAVALHSHHASVCTPMRTLAQLCQFQGPHPRSAPTRPPLQLCKLTTLLCVSFTSH